MRLAVHCIGFVASALLVLCAAERYLAPAEKTASQAIGADPLPAPRTFHAEAGNQSLRRLNGSTLDVDYRADGNRHSHDALPTLIAGRGGNFVKSGRRVGYLRETPICNLYMTLMDRMGVHVEHFGDATGQLKGVDLS